MIQTCTKDWAHRKDETLLVYKLFGYSLPLTNLATQTEFSQPEKDCSS